MFFKNRNKKERPAWLTSFYLDFIKPFTDGVQHKMRLKGRKRLANRWAGKHPKKVVWSYAICAILILSLNFVPFFIKDSSPKSNDLLGLTNMKDFNEHFDFLSLSQSKYMSIKKTIGELGEKGLNMYSEMDSLMKKESKTHADSVRIYQIYNVLNKTFNNTEHGFKEN